MAKVISRIAGASAQIVPYDIKSRIAQVTRAQRENHIQPGEALRVKQRRNGDGAMSMVEPAHLVRVAQGRDAS
jgi:hypothetical protein